MFTSGNPGRWRIIRKGHKPKASMTNFLHILHIPEQMAWVEKKKLVKTVKIIQLYCPAREHSLEVSMNKSRSHLSICHSSLILESITTRTEGNCTLCRNTELWHSFSEQGRKYTEFHLKSSQPQLATTINYTIKCVCMFVATSDVLKWITRYNWKRAAL